MKKRKSIEQTFDSQVSKEEKIKEDNTISLKLRGQSGPCKGYIVVLFSNFALGPKFSKASLDMIVIFLGRNYHIFVTNSPMTICLNL